MRSLAPCELERACEPPLGVERLVAVRALAAHGRKLGGKGEPLEQRRLARPVLADEKGHQAVRTASVPSSRMIGTVNGKRSRSIVWPASSATVRGGHSRMLAVPSGQERHGDGGIFTG